MNFEGVNTARELDNLQMMPRWVDKFAQINLGLYLFRLGVFKIRKTMRIISPSYCIIGNRISPCEMKRV